MKVLVIEDWEKFKEKLRKAEYEVGTAVKFLEECHELHDVVQFEAKVGSVNQPITHLRELGESFKVGDRLIVLVAKKEEGK